MLQSTVVELKNASVLSHVMFFRCSKVRKRLACSKRALSMSRVYGCRWVSQDGQAR